MPDKSLKCESNTFKNPLLSIRMETVLCSIVKINELKCSCCKCCIERNHKWNVFMCSMRMEITSVILTKLKCIVITLN